ncbi:MAG: ELWxxDGT repeat protein, partial [Planctomycetaceae bacterium]
VLVADIRPGSNGSSPSEITNVNGTLFFRADDGTNGRELWKSDGTTAGTVLVADINPGSGDALLGSLANVDGNLWFTADDPAAGREPFLLSLTTPNGIWDGDNVVFDDGTGQFVGSWEDAANWSNDVLPDAVTDVVIDAAGTTILLSQNQTVQSLALSAGTLTLPGLDFTIGGALNWTGGTLRSGHFPFGGTPGAVDVFGTTTIDGDVTLDGIEWQLVGDTNWNAGTLFVTNGPIITNNPGATFTIVGDGDRAIVNLDDFSSPRFDNLGIVRQTGNGTTTFGVEFNNLAGDPAGRLQADAGTVLLTKGTNTGTFVGNGTIEIVADYVLDTGTYAFDTLRISSGVTRVRGTTDTFAVNQFELNGGTVELEIDAAIGAVTWTAGTLRSNDVRRTLVIGGGTSTISDGLGAKTLENIHVVMAGLNTVWSGGDINLANNAAVAVAAGSTFTIQADAPLLLQTNVGDTTLFTNRGRILKVGNNTAQLDATVFINERDASGGGVLDLQQGTLLIGGSGGGAGGSVWFDIAGPMADEQYDRFVVEGLAGLDLSNASLNLVLTGGF